MNASEAKRMADEYCLNQESARVSLTKESVDFALQKIKELAQSGHYELSITSAFLRSNLKVVLSYTEEEEVLKRAAEALEEEYGYHVYKDRKNPIPTYVVKWK